MTIEDSERLLDNIGIPTQAKYKENHSTFENSTSGMAPFRSTGKI